MLPLWQTLADNFYPERADFTVTRNLGQELAVELIDSYPILSRRDMGDQLAAMLRDGEWFENGTTGTPDYDGRMWLQWSTQRLRSLFNNRKANFTRSTKQGDHDYITFGQCVISCTVNKDRSGLLFQNWHLRDCAWYEDASGSVCGLHRKWKPTLYQAIQAFGKDRLAPALVTASWRTPHAEANFVHILMPAEQYGDEKYIGRFKYVSIWLDLQNDHVIEEVGSNVFFYVVPRFQTIAGSQYAYSAATVVALPDARLIQAMTHTLLEAGERYTRPPMVARADVVRGDVDLAPDGITWVDKLYDERQFGAALAPLAQSMGGFPFGEEMRADIKETIASAFYLNKLTLPSVDHTMTAYEVQERMKQYRRETLPLFAPIEADYNGQLCEIAFEQAMNAGFLGSPMDIPDSLKGQDIQFKFNSPLSAADEEKKAQLFQQVSAMLGEIANIPQSSAGDQLNLEVAMRDAIQGIGAPQYWLASPKQVLAKQQARAQQQQAALLAQAAGANPQEAQQVAGAM